MPRGAFTPAAPPRDAMTPATGRVLMFAALARRRAVASPPHVHANTLRYMSPGAAPPRRSACYTARSYLRHTRLPSSLLFSERRLICCFRRRENVHFRIARWFAAPPLLSVIAVLPLYAPGYGAVLRQRQNAEEGIIVVHAGTGSRPILPACNIRSAPRQQAPLLSSFTQQQSTAGACHQIHVLSLLHFRSRGLGCSHPTYV